MTDDREVFKVRRDAGLAKRHETREARAIRRQVAEEIAAAIERSEDDARRLGQQCQLQGDKAGELECSHLATGYMRSAELAREIGSKEAT
jgi:hypothetical protein